MRVRFSPRNLSLLPLQRDRGFIIDRVRGAVSLASDTISLLLADVFSVRGHVNRFTRAFLLLAKHELSRCFAGKARRAFADNETLFFFFF